MAHADAVGAVLRVSARGRVSQAPPPMTAPRLEDYGLSEAIVEEVRSRERTQFELFVRLTGGAAAVVWLLLTVFVYTHSFHRAPLLGLAVAPLLALVGAAITSLPLAIVCGLGTMVFYPRHPSASAVERYEADSASVRPCDVCVLARGDDRPQENVRYCARCGAWICPACRARYDLRAIAALRRKSRPPSADSGAPPR